MGAATHYWWAAAAPLGLHLVNLVVALILSQRAVRRGDDIEMEVGLSRLRFKSISRDHIHEGYVPEASTSADKAALSEPYEATRPSASQASERPVRAGAVATR
jgi:hypothetical protein